MKAYQLFQFIHADGTAKEWGYCDLGKGQTEIRWGPENQLRQSQVKPAQEARSRAEEKLRKGYHFLGTVYLNTSGSRATPQPSPPTHRTPVDLAALLGGGEGFYFP